MSEAARVLTSKRCFNHPQREAAALCPECGRYFCRECVTEHENRVLCASCLRASKIDKGKDRSILAPVLRFTQVALGVLIAGLFFYYMAEALLFMPDSFHDGTVWEKAGEFFR